jgi:hypothetical protein
MLERLSESAVMIMTRRYTRSQGRVALCLELDFGTSTVTWKLDTPDRRIWRCSRRPIGNDASTFSGDQLAHVGVGLAML